MTKRSFAWLAINEDIDPATGCYLETPQAWEAEKRELTKLNAPDVEELELIGMIAEGRDEVMVEALATERFIAWAKQGPDGTPVENGDSNLVYYDE